MALLNLVALPIPQRRDWEQMQAKYEHWLRIFDAHNDTVAVWDARWEDRWVSRSQSSAGREGGSMVMVSADGWVASRIPVSAIGVSAPAERHRDRARTCLQTAPQSLPPPNRASVALAPASAGARAAAPRRR